MKKLVLFFLLGIVYSLLSAQETTNYFNYSPTIKKGTILLDSGNRLEFNNLNIEKDSVFFSDTKSSYLRLSLSNIEQITKTKSSVGMDILIGGTSGLLSGILVGILVYPNRTFGEILVDKINNEDESQTIRKEAYPIIAIGTVSGIAIGALVGLLKKKEKVVYQKHTSIEFFPELTSFPNQDAGLMLTVKIQLK